MGLLADRTAVDTPEAPMTEPVTGPASEAQVLGGDEAQTVREHAPRLPHAGRGRRRRPATARRRGGEPRAPVRVPSVRIVQMSDLHVGTALFRPDLLTAAVAETNELGP